MQITVNDKPLALADGSSVVDLIEQLGLAGKRIAIEINEDIVPRSSYGTTTLQPGDRIEIVHAIGGG